MIRPTFRGCTVISEANLPLKNRQSIRNVCKYFKLPLKRKTLKFLISKLTRVLRSAASLFRDPPISLWEPFRCHHRLLLSLWRQRQEKLHLSYQSVYPQSRKRLPYFYQHTDMSLCFILRVPMPITYRKYLGTLYDRGPLCSNDKFRSSRRRETIGRLGSTMSTREERNCKFKYDMKHRKKFACSKLFAKLEASRQFNE